jgi:mono/diheme cytochrome c family protein
MPDIPDFTDSSWHRNRTDAQLLVSILEGKGRLMPTWWGKFSDQQAADLVAHVRTFNPAPPPVVAETTSVSSTDFWKEFADLQRQRDELEQQMKGLPAVKVKGTPLAVPVAGTPMSGAGRFFGQSCAGCHTIGGGSLTGPDLKNVTQRRDRDWLVRLLLDPKSVIHSGDPYALQLLAKARGVVMPNIFGMTRERAEALIDFIEAQSKVEKSWFSELPISGRPLTPDDAERGQELFVGLKPFTNGGPACIACHAASGTGDLEGGRLGPDLTKVYERVGGRTALSARLWTPATPTMLPVYQQHTLQEDEILSLVAYLEQTAREGVERGSGPPMHFVLAGLGGAVLGLLAFGVLWGTGSRSSSLVVPSAEAPNNPTT